MTHIANLTPIVVSFDADLRNADWIKGGQWDAWTIGLNGNQKLVETVEEMLEYLNVNNEPFPIQLREVEHFMTLRSSLKMPESLKIELRRLNLLSQL